MKLNPVVKPYFSEDESVEKRWLMFLWIAAGLSALILALAWPQTRSVEFIRTLGDWTTAPVEIFFRAITFLGDDQFFMIFFSVLLWCVNKSLGFWGAFVLLTSATYSNFIKDLTLLERPPLEGVAHPEGSYAFPSGHTLTAVTVWGYLAVRLKIKALYPWAVVAVFLIGFSRLVLGYHFLGDILGGIAFGIPFLLFFLWVSRVFYEKGLLERFTFPLLLVLSILVPLFFASVLPGADPPKILGYTAGISLGFLLESRYIRSSLQGPLLRQVIKSILGLAVLFGIILGLGGLLPSAQTYLGFIRYALGGVWATLGAPALFVACRLSGREK